MRLRFLQSVTAAISPPFPSWQSISDRPANDARTHVPPAISSPNPTKLTSGENSQLFSGSDSEGADKALRCQAPTTCDSDRC